LALKNPSAIIIFSQMSTRSGTITVIGLKRALRPSGSSDRPRYPVGLIGLYIEGVGLIGVNYIEGVGLI
jgi:hypothetical protein